MLFIMDQVYNETFVEDLVWEARAGSGGGGSTKGRQITWSGPASPAA